MLTGALALAVLTPAYIANALPDSAVYHRSVYVFALQALPYIVCAAIWLPLRHPSAPIIAWGLSVLLFVVACVLYVPSLVRPRSGGDMVGLWYAIVCAATTSAVLVISVIALVTVEIRRRLRSRTSAPG
jgi:hypothetical protein